MVRHDYGTKQVRWFGKRRRICCIYRLESGATIAERRHAEYKKEEEEEYHSDYIT